MVYLLMCAVGTSTRRSTFDFMFSHPSSKQWEVGIQYLNVFLSFVLLKKLVELEISTGVQFRHIRLLAKAFTHSSMQYSSLVGYESDLNVYV